MQEAAFGIIRNSEERIRGREDTEIIAIMSVYAEVDDCGKIWLRRLFRGHHREEEA
jgi:hypothetical protein